MIHTVFINQDKKRERKPEPYEKQYTPYEPLKQVLAFARARTFAKPSERDPSEDYNNFIDEMNKPLPQSYVIGYVPAKLNDYHPDYNTMIEDLPENHAISKKFSGARSDLLDFERMLDDKFKKVTKKPISTEQVRRSTRRHDDDDEPFGNFLERELGVIVGDDEKLESSGKTVKTYNYSKDGLPVLKSHSKLGSHQTIEDYGFEDDFSALRSKTVESKSKMGHHKDLLDRYLPVEMGDNPDVKYEIADKYNQLATRYEM